MKVAIVHYWLVQMRGGEKVLQSLCRIFPQADIFTHVIDSDSISEDITSHKISTTFISKLPFAKTSYQKYLPLMPLALEELDLTSYDLIISSESGPAKGVITSPGSLHICYCHSPMRYVWDQYYRYVSELNIFKRFLISPIMHYLRSWDYLSATRVDHFIANSSFVARRINKFYRRSADIVNPPVADYWFQVPPDCVRGDFYLYVGQLVSYKEPDLAVSAFIELGLNLIIVGSGERLPEIKELAEQYPNISILGKVDDEQLRRLYGSAKALIFPGVEDFGIIPLEAMATGCPVIALGIGGVLDTIVEGVTGTLYDENSTSALQNAVAEVESGKLTFRASVIKEHAKKFRVESFEFKLKTLIFEKLNNKRRSEQNQISQ